MKILFFTIGNEEVASSRTRVYQYLPYLRREGIECRLIFHIAPWQFKKVINMQKVSLFIKLCGKIYSFFKTTAFLFSAPKYDLLFIQRVLLPVRIQKLVKRLNKNIVFDFDDAIFLADRYLHRLNGKFLRRFNYTLKNCKYIIVANNFLKEKVLVLNKNVFILTTPLDTDRLFPKKTDKSKDDIVIGWIGSPDSSRYLRNLRDVFKILVEKYHNLKFEFIGADNFYKRNNNITIKEWRFNTEIENLQNFDIGIMPLNDDDWCQGKGGYKLLQYMAVGIPCVASPVGINKEIIKDGIDGFLANTPNDWLDKLSSLIEDASLRHKLGEEGRRLVKTLYSYRVSAPRLIEILKSDLRLKIGMADR